MHPAGSFQNILRTLNACCLQLLQRSAVQFVELVRHCLDPLIHPVACDVLPEALGLFSAKHFEVQLLLEVSLRAPCASRRERVYALQQPYPGVTHGALKQFLVLRLQVVERCALGPLNGLHGVDAQVCVVVHQQVGHLPPDRPKA